jgi:hypothetical protein
MGKARLLAGLGWCLAVCGCVGLGGSRFLNQDQVPPRPQPVDFRADVSDLRIPGDSLVSAAQVAGKERGTTSDIPLVPVPLPPLGGDGKGRATPPGAPSPASPVTPASLQLGPTPQPASPALAAGGVKTPKELHELAVAGFADVDSFVARLTRRETLKGKANGEEVLLFAFRKKPWSVHFKWLAGEGQGREVVYVKGRYENKLHTLLAAGDVPLMPAGHRLSLPIDSFLVRSASKHPITEAGIGAMIEKIGLLLQANVRGDKRFGPLTALGREKRPDYPVPLDMIEVKLAPGADIDLPNGGKRLFGFDPETHLPVLAILLDDRGREAEYYRFDRIQLSVHLDDADFDPDRLWPPRAEANRQRP